MLKCSFYALVGVCLLFSSCKKNSNSKTTCTSTVSGYTFKWAPATDAYGLINLGSASLATQATFTDMVYGVYDDGAAFNTADNSYYFIKHDTTTGNTLVKIDLAGTVTTFTRAAGDVSGYRSMLYNQFNNKLYFVKDTSLAEVVISGTNFSGTALITSDYLRDLSTVNNATGDIYFGNKSDTTTWNIHKYHPGASASSPVATITGCFYLSGLRFNKNDNMLYALNTNGISPITFIKIDPALGTTTTLSSLTFDVNPEFYSSVIDPCTNQYIISSPENLTLGGYSFDSSLINHLSMSGALVQHNVTNGTFLGLTIH